jgi:hypothetical protein
LELEGIEGSKRQNKRKKLRILLQWEEQRKDGVSCSLVRLSEPHGQILCEMLYPVSIIYTLESTRKIFKIVSWWYPAD